MWCEYRSWYHTSAVVPIPAVHVSISSTAYSELLWGNLDTQTAKPRPISDHVALVAINQHRSMIEVTPGGWSWTAEPKLWRLCRFAITLLRMAADIRKSDYRNSHFALLTIRSFERFRVLGFWGFRLSVLLVNGEFATSWFRDFVFHPFPSSLHLPVPRSFGPSQWKLFRGLRTPSSDFQCSAICSKCLLLSLMLK